ncbi:hypothetical protein C2W62_47455 [Candidatus Entotheonella serta]|nr:hypothetical protein C2W62_47455 [Candidatus Entotheonella serta]
MSEKALRIIGRELACTEVGCALSHIQIYHQMVKENIDELLILEDDVVITQDFLELIKCRHRFPQDYDLINFQTTAIKYPIGEYICKKVSKKPHAWQSVVPSGESWRCKASTRCFA